MAVPAAPDQRSGVATASSAAGATSGRSPRFRRGLLVVLIVVVVAAAVSIAYLAATRPVQAFGLDVRDGKQAAIQADREQVMSQAEQFMIRINTYGPDDLDGDQMPSYRKLVEEVITPKFAADFEKNVPAAEATVKQAQVARTAKVFSAGVSTLDADSATALVAGQFTQSYPESADSANRVETDPAPFRVTVQLVKIKGEWLVDDFAPVVDADSDSAGGTGGTPLPSPYSQPSGQPSGQGSTRPSASPSAGDGTSP